MELANALVESVKENQGKKLQFMYDLEEPLKVKIEKVAKKLYGADGVDFDRDSEVDIDLYTKHGYGNFPVCIVKTPKSLSDNAKLLGLPKGFWVTVNEPRISAGARFVVVICGNIMTMPGLPMVSATLRIKKSPDGRAIGLSQEYSIQCILQLK